MSRSEQQAKGSVPSTAGGDAKSSQKGDFAGGTQDCGKRKVIGHSMSAPASLSAVMPDPAVEREHLAKAEHAIAEGERRVTRQMLLIERMRREGQDTSEAERLLLALQETLAEWETHREEVLQELERHRVLR